MTPIQSCHHCSPTAPQLRPSPRLPPPPLLLRPDQVSSYTILNTHKHTPPLTRRSFVLSGWGDRFVVFLSHRKKEAWFGRCLDKLSQEVGGEVPGADQEGPGPHRCLAPEDGGNHEHTRWSDGAHAFRDGACVTEIKIFGGGSGKPGRWT